jgi:hypothetical protein
MARILVTRSLIAGSRASRPVQGIRLAAAYRDVAQASAAHDALGITRRHTGRWDSRFPCQHCSLAAFSLGVTGSYTPYIPPLAYLIVIAAAAALTYAVTEVAARGALRG